MYAGVTHSSEAVSLWPLPYTKPCNSCLSLNSEHRVNFMIWFLEAQFSPPLMRHWDASGWVAKNLWGASWLQCSPLSDGGVRASLCRLSPQRRNGRKGKSPLPWHGKESQREGHGQPVEKSPRLHFISQNFLSTSLSKPLASLVFFLLTRLPRFAPPLSLLCIPSRRTQVQQILWWVSSLSLHSISPNK